MTATLLPRRPVREAPAPSSDDDALFAAFLASGDRRALEALVARWWEPAVRLARRVLSSTQAAEDAAQEALVSLARAAGRGAVAPGPFAPWLRTLVLNAARNAARGESRRARHEDRAERRSAARRLEREEDPGARAERRLDAAVIEEHVRRLPEEARFALAFHFYEGRSHVEVAAALGCPERTATSRIRRGLEKLRDSLGRAGYGASVPEVASLLGASGPAIGGAVRAAPQAADILARAAALSRRAAIVKAGAAALLAVACVLGGARALLPSDPPRRVALAADASSGDGVSEGAGASGTGRDRAPKIPEEAPPAGPSVPDRPAPPPAGSPPAAVAGVAPPAGAPAGVAPVAPTPAALARLLVVADLTASGERSAAIWLSADASPVVVQVIAGERPGQEYALAAGTYVAYVGAGVEYARTSNPTVAEEVRLEAGEERAVRLVVPPPDRRAGIEVAARLPDGAPARGVALRVRRDMSAVEAGRTSQPSHETTDDEGVARFGLWPAGTYIVDAAERGEVARIEHHGGAPERHEVAIPAVVATRLVLVDGAGLPVPGIEAAIPGYDHLGLVSLEDGCVAVVRDLQRRAVERPARALRLPEGRLALRLRRPDGAWEPVAAVNDGRGEVRVRAPWSRSISVEGSLADASLAPDGARVEAHLCGRDGTEHTSRAVVAGGAFSLVLEDVSATARPAELYLRIGSAAPYRYALGEGEAGVRLGSIFLERGVAVSGRVTLRGEPLKRGEVVYRARGCPFAFAVELDEPSDGRFRFDGLPPGPGALGLRGLILSARAAAAADVLGFRDAARDRNVKALEVDPGTSESVDLGELEVRWVD